MMTNYIQQARYLKLLAHPIRLQILDLLRHGELCVCHIENALHKRQAYISQQLMVLREAKVVDSRKDGLQVYYRLVDPLIADVLDTVCGQVDDAQHEVLPDCPCPTCCTVRVNP